MQAPLGRTGVVRRKAASVQKPSVPALVTHLHDPVTRLAFLPEPGKFSIYDQFVRKGHRGESEARGI